MREIPILFSTPMVQAILEGRKSMTRRVIKPQPPEWINQFGYSMFTPPRHISGRGTFNNELVEKFLKMPYQPGIKLLSSPTQAGWYDVKWEPGDNWERIWVFEGGETWGRGPNDDPEAIDLDIAAPNLTEWKTPGDLLWVRETWAEVSSGIIEYKASYQEPYTGLSDIDHVGKKIKWKSPRFMPKVAARIWLEVVSVKVERLQGITEEDAVKEGVKAYGPNNCSGTSARIAFAELWDSLNAKRGYGWDVNPWVWVIEFKRVDHD